MDWMRFSSPREERSVHRTDGTAKPLQALERRSAYRCEGDPPPLAAVVVVPAPKVAVLIIEERTVPDLGRRVGAVGLVPVVPVVGGLAIDLNAHSFDAAVVIDRGGVAAVLLPARQLVLGDDVVRGRL